MTTNSSDKNAADKSFGTHNGGVTVYWRPGCPFCMSLERSLKSSGVEYDRRNIWDEPKAAEFVRSVANGNETVPTVAIGNVFKVNPTGNEVLAIMSEETPDLVPEGADQRSGPVGSAIRRILGG